MELLFILGFVVAALVGFVFKRNMVRETLSVLASSIALVGVITVALKVAAEGHYAPFSFVAVDSLGAIIMLIIGTVGLAATIYSVAYLRHELKKKVIDLKQHRLFFTLLNLFLAVMYMAVASSSPIFTWVCVEATTLSTALLISFYNKPSAMEAAWKYLIVNSIGLLLGFFGTLLYFTITHTLAVDGFITWQALLDNASHLDPVMAKVAFVFVLIGYGTKAGFVPMHTWLPDAHSKAPSPVSALLSGVLLNVALYVILKFKAITDVAATPGFTDQALIIFGLMSVVFAAFIIVTQQHYKRMLAYSSIENMGLIALGFGFGGVGILAAIMHMIYHALVKSSLFFMSGNILLKYSSGHIKKVQGALTALPITGVLLIAGVLAITGMPPFGIFFTEFFTFSAGIKDHLPVVIVVILALAVMFIGFMRNANSMLFGKVPTGIKPGEINIWLVVPPVVLLSLVLVMTFYLPPFLQTLIHDAASRF